MQKVSKKSLVYILLSILFVMTFSMSVTYAVFSAQKTITGTVSFTADLSMEITPGTSANGITFSTITNGINIVFSQDAFEFDGAKFKLTSNAKNTLAGAKVTITAQGNKTYYYKTTFTAPTNNALTMSVNTSAFTGSANTATKEVTLNNIITEVQVTNSVTSNNSFTLLFDVSYANINA